MWAGGGYRMRCAAMVADGEAGDATFEQNNPENGLVRLKARRHRQSANSPLPVHPPVWKWKHDDEEADGSSS